MRALRSSRRAASSEYSSPGPAPPRLSRSWIGTGLVSARREGENSLVHRTGGRAGAYQGEKHREDGPLALQWGPRMPGPEVRRGRERAAERLCSLRPVGVSAERRPPRPSYRLCAAARIWPARSSAAGFPGLPVGRGGCGVTGPDPTPARLQAASGALQMPE